MTADASDKNIYDTVYDGNKHTDKYTDKHTDKYTDKHTDKYTDKHTDKYTDKHTDKYTDKHTDKADEGSRFSSDAKTVADVHKPPQTDVPEKRSRPFDLSQKAVPPSSLPLPEHPFAKTTSRMDSPQFPSKEVAPDLQSEKVKESFKSLRRQEFLNLSKMTDSSRKMNLIHPFAVGNQMNSYGSSTSGFSLSPVYDVPYPSPCKKSKPQMAFQDSKPSYNVSTYSQSHYCSKDLPFLSSSTSNSEQHSYTSCKNVDKVVDVTPVCRSPHSSSPTSRPFLSSASNSKKYPYPVDCKSVNVGGANMDQFQYHVMVSESPFPSLFSYPYYSTSANVFSSNQTKDSPKSFYGQENIPVAPTTSQSGKGILLRQKAHYITGEVPKTLWNKREEPYRSTRNPSSIASNVATNKSVNFKLSTEDGIKIISCGSEEVYPEDEGPLLTSSDSENLKFDRKDSSYNFTLHKPHGFTKPKMYFNAGLGRKSDRSSLSSEDSDMRSSSSVASSRRDQSDSSADNTLTLLTIKQSYTSEDKLEKELSSLVIGRIDKPSKHDPPLKPFSSAFRSSISRTLGKSDAKLLSKLSRSDIPLHQVPLNKASPSKTLHFVSPNHAPSNPEAPNQLRLDILSANQIPTLPRGGNKVSEMLANRLPSMTPPTSQSSPIRLNKLSHFEGVMPSQGEGSQKGKSIITLEKFSWKDENAVQPGTFVQHERTKTKTDNKVTLRASLKLKSATVDGKEKLALSQKVAIASKTLAGNQTEGRHPGSGKKVVVSRLDLSKGHDLIASGMTMDMYKLHKEPSSATGMRWNAVRRLMQHMCTDQHGNKHFFFGWSCI